MNRAADYNECHYWRKEFCCLYLRLIPFVTERNVMRVYPVFFHRAKHAAKEKRSDGLMHILAPSMLAICICAICLCGVGWAWFTASTSTGTTQIQSSSYKLVYQVNEDTAAIELAEVKTVTVPESGSCKIKLSATGTATAPAATQPETTDTEPAPAPETTTPEDTTAVLTEPPTTEESESN